MLSKRHHTARSRSNPAARTHQCAAPVCKVSSLGTSALFPPSLRAGQLHLTEAPISPRPIGERPFDKRSGGPAPKAWEGEGGAQISREVPPHLPIADALGPLLSPGGEEERHVLAKCDSPASGDREDVGSLVAFDRSHRHIARAFAATSILATASVARHSSLNCLPRLWRSKHSRMAGGMKRVSWA